MRHPASPFARLLFLTTMLACADATAPRTPTRPAVGGGSALASPAPVVVHPGELHGWTFVRAHGAPCDTTACRLVTGPGAPPLGTGSAELSSGPGAGSALVLDDFAGVRLDHLTALRYATYTQGGDPTNDAAVTLQLDIAFDSGAASTSEVGRLTHEPSKDGAARAAPGRWQSRDARAGLWWSDREAPQAVHGSDAHPCVQARPCTWAGLLARFPNAVLRSNHGVVRLAARKEAPFRGNVDSLVVGIDGSDLVFDFEAEAPKVFHALSRAVGAGVVVSGLPDDTLFRAGSVVDYAFTPAAGHATPLVILDDTLAPAAGRIVMNAPHALRVVADTVYALATSTPLEQRLAQLTSDLMTSGDKLAAAQAFNEFVIASTATPEVLARAAEVADYLVVDPVRDSAAIRAVDAVLSARDFFYEYAGAGRIGVSNWPQAPEATTSASRLLDRRPMAGAAPPAASAPSATPASSAIVAPAGTHRSYGVISDVNNSGEYTKVIYTNGIFTFRGAAFVSATLLAKLVYAQPHFAGWYTSVVMHYNPTYVNEMAAYDRDHPCVAGAERSIAFSSPETRLVAYAACKGMRFAKSVVANDYVEAVRARSEFTHGLQPTTAAVTSLANLVARLRSRSGDTHVMLVGHSEGTILQAQAVRLLPSLEGHPLEVANRCLAVLQLAPATSRPDYGMDEYHLKGLLADNDLIWATLPAGWESVQTPFTRIARDSIVHSWFKPQLIVDLGKVIHGVNFTYLSGPVASIVAEHLVTMHRECIPGSAELHLIADVVPIEGRVSASLDIWNQNNRPLIGRQLALRRWEYYFDRVDSLTFRAMAPHETPITVAAVVTRGLEVRTPVTIPLLQPDFTIRETLLWDWAIVGESNGADGGYSEIPPPTMRWDGSPASCGQQTTLVGTAGNTRTFELHCNRAYTFVYTVPDTLSTGRPVLGAAVYVTNAAGVTSAAPPLSYYCPGGAECIRSGYVEWKGAAGILARSLTVAPVVQSASANLMSASAVRPNARSRDRTVQPAPRALLPRRPGSP